MSEQMPPEDSRTVYPVWGGKRFLTLRAAIIVSALSRRTVSVGKSSPEEASFLSSREVTGPVTFSPQCE